MNTIKKRALQLFDYALAHNLAGTQKELCVKIGLVHTGITVIKNTAGRSFTHEQLQELARLTNANLNWVYGFEKNMFREKKTIKPIQLLREAVTLIEQEMKGR